MNAIDTNVWIYSRDARDPVKRERAQALISEIGELVLLWQVGCEFLAAARKLEPQGFDADDAWAALADMKNMADVVLLPDPRTWEICRDISSRSQLHFWDALIVAACLQGGVRTLYSEDFGALGRIDDLVIVNPFLEEPK